MIGPAIPEKLLQKRPNNESEIVISLSDDEENEFVGPQIPTQKEVAGPQIPQHLLNKKRSEEKNNADEINMSDDEEQDDNIGPRIPRHLQKSVDIGPQIPQHLLQNTNINEIHISDDEQDDDVGPQLPDHLLEKKQTVEDTVDPDDFAPALPPDLLEQRQKTPVGRRRRPVGPSFPTGPMPEEDDEYIVGPALPKDYNPEEDAKYSAIHAIEDRAREAKEAMEKKESDKGKVERPEWMLLPPEVDYLKTANSSKSRQFSNRTMTEKERDSSGWTETPAQKQLRLEEERSGKRSRAEEDIGYSALDIERRKNVQQYNNQTRPLSLMEIHQQNRKKHKKEVEDVTKRAFDREKDLLGGKKIDRKAKNELVKQSSEFGQKFYYGSSSFL